MSELAKESTGNLDSISNKYKGFSSLPKEVQNLIFTNIKQIEQLQEWDVLTHLWDTTIKAYNIFGDIMIQTPTPGFAVKDLPSNYNIWTNLTDWTYFSKIWNIFQKVTPALEWGRTWIYKTSQWELIDRQWKKAINTWSIFLFKDPFKDWTDVYVDGEWNTTDREWTKFTTAFRAMEQEIKKIFSSSGRKIYSLGDSQSWVRTIIIQWLDEDVNNDTLIETSTYTGKNWLFQFHVYNEWDKNISKTPHSQESLLHYIKTNLKKL